MSIQTQFPASFFKTNVLALFNQLTMSRASARTNPETGAEIASGVAYTTTLTEAVAASITEMVDSSGYIFRGQHPDGRYIFEAVDGTYASNNGMPPYTKISDYAASRVTPSGTLLRFGGTPATIARVPGPDYNIATNVLTFDRGFPSTQGVSGTSPTWGASGMNYAADGNTIWLSEYGASDIKDSSDSPRSLWRSDDDGETWTQVEKWPQVSGTHHHSIYYDVPTGNLYCSLGDGIQANSGIWKSTDRGDTWTKLTPPSGSTHMQPVSGMRFGDYIVWGTDTVPTGIWLHNPTTDAIERIRFDYEDGGISITWTGVAYYMAVVNDLLVVLSSQGQENYHTVMVSDDARRWWRLADMDTAALGWSQPVLLGDGSLLMRPGQTTTPNFWKLSGIALRERTVLATDFATNAIVQSATPLADGAYTMSSGVYVEGGGPNGMRSAKIGGLSRSPRVDVTVGEVIEWTVWVRNPLGMTNQIYLQMFFVTSGGSFFNQAQKTIPNPSASAGWVKHVYRFTVPATAATAGISLLTSGFTFNATTAYYEVAGLSIARVLDAGIETHNRAAESATLDRAVGAAWGVYDRIYPRWDSKVLNYNVTLLTLTDIDTADEIEVRYNGTDKTIELLQSGGSTVSSAAVRCYGEPRKYLYGSAVRQVFSEPDGISYGVRVNAGVAKLVVWERATREVATYEAVAAFAPTNLRIEFPASGVLHLPHLATKHLSDSQLIPLLMGIS